MENAILNNDNKILVTGAAGFIGYHLSNRLLEMDLQVVGLDNMDPYYDVSLKAARVNELKKHDQFEFVGLDLADKLTIDSLFEKHKFGIVVNLAAQAGVRYSLKNPKAYVDTNLSGFFHILDVCRRNNVKHFVYASSSSVYGLNTKIPFSVHDNVDHPVSLYAASKKANELMAHTYSHLFSLPTTGLRFFTVYGPWGRPDMALFKFSRSIFLGEPLELYNHGDMMRDFTYIDDIVGGIIHVMGHPAEGNSSWSGENPDPGSSPAPYKLYNIGRGNCIELRRFLQLIEEKMGKKAIVHEVGMQDGDVQKTWAEVDDLEQDFGYSPKVDIEEGIGKFLDWFLDYYGSGRPIPQ